VGTVMNEIIRDGLSGPLSWYQGLGIALAATLVGVAAYLGTRSRSKGVSITYTFPSLLWPWLAMSAFWIIGVFYVESLDGLLAQELGEVFTTAFVPPIVPPVVIAGITRILADISRP
jgi:hypothetical protein